MAKKIVYVQSNPQQPGNPENLQVEYSGISVTIQVGGFVGHIH
jgi:hypothetical protein